MPIAINGTGTITGISVGGLPDATITPAELTQPLTSGTAVASTSGTSIDFTGIPSWVKRITVMFSGVSTNGSSYPYLIQLGDSGGIETSGYLGSSGYITSSTPASVNVTTGFGILVDNSADNTVHGSMTISLLNASTNTWVSSSVFGMSNREFTLFNGASKSLSATLDRVRITTANGTDVFDAGTINILYE